ncbi:hypothetical protein BGZ83_009554 [Gryganskiella cystojenkinii]|nr:hypothetical protein BGZ83_009554 [Gryganskiella cystojenkinii]
MSNTGSLPDEKRKHYDRKVERGGDHNEHADARAVHVVGTSALKLNSHDFNIASAEHNGKGFLPSGHDNSQGSHFLAAQGNSEERDSAGKSSYYGLNPSFFKKDAYPNYFGTSERHDLHPNDAQHSHGHHSPSSGNRGTSTISGVGHHSSKVANQESNRSSREPVPRHELTHADSATSDGPTAAAGTTRKLGAATLPATISHPAHGDTSAAAFGQYTAQGVTPTANKPSSHQPNSDHLGTLYHPTHRVTLFHDQDTGATLQHDGDRPHAAAVSAAFGGAGMLEHASHTIPDNTHVHGLVSSLPVHRETASSTHHGPTAHHGSVAHQPIEGPEAVAVAAAAAHDVDLQHEHHYQEHQHHHTDAPSYQGGHHALPTGDDRHILRPAHSAFPSGEHSAGGHHASVTASHERPHIPNAGLVIGLGSAAALVAHDGSSMSAKGHGGPSATLTEPASVTARRAGAAKGPAIHSFSPSQDRPVHVPEAKPKGHYLTHSSSFGKKKSSISGNQSSPKVLPKFVPANLRRPHVPPTASTPSLSRAVVASGPVHTIFTPRPSDHFPQSATSTSSHGNQNGNSHLVATPVTHASVNHLNALSSATTAFNQPQNASVHAQGSATAHSAGMTATNSTHYNHHPQQPHLTHQAIHLEKTQTEPYKPSKSGSHGTEVHYKKNTTAPSPVAISSISARHVEPLVYKAETPVVYVADKTTSTKEEPVTLSKAAAPLVFASTTAPHLPQGKTQASADTDSLNFASPGSQPALEKRYDNVGPLAAATAAIGAGAAAVRSAASHGKSNHKEEKQETEGGHDGTGTFTPTALETRTPATIAEPKVEVEKTFVGPASEAAAVQVTHGASKDAALQKTTELTTVPKQDAQKPEKKLSKSAKRNQKAKEKALEKAQAEVKAAKENVSKDNAATSFASTSTVTKALGDEKTARVTKTEETIAAAVPTTKLTGDGKMEGGGHGVKKHGKKESDDSNGLATTKNGGHAHGTGAKMAEKIAAVAAVPVSVAAAVAHKLRRSSHSDNEDEKAVNISQSAVSMTKPETKTTGNVALAEPVLLVSTPLPQPHEQVTTEKSFPDEDVVMLKTTTTTVLVTPEADGATVKGTKQDEKEHTSAQTKVEVNDNAKKLKEKKPLDISGKISSATASSAAAVSTAAASVSHAAVSAATAVSASADAYKKRQPNIQKPVLLVKEDDVEKPKAVAVSKRLTLTEDDVEKPTVPAISPPVLTLTEDDVEKPSVDFDAIGHPILKLHEDDVEKPDPTNAPHPVIPKIPAKTTSSNARKVATAPRPMIPATPVQGKDIKLPKVHIPKVSMPTLPAWHMPKMPKAHMPHMPMIPKRNKKAKVKVPKAVAADHIKTVTTTTRTIVDPPFEAQGVRTHVVEDELPVAVPLVVAATEHPVAQASKSVEIPKSVALETVKTHVVEHSKPADKPVIIEPSISVAATSASLKPTVVETMAPKPIAVETDFSHEVEDPKPFITASTAAPVPIAPPEPVAVVVHELFSTNAERVPAGYNGPIPKVHGGDTLIWVKKIETKQEYYDSEEEDDQQLDQFGYRKDRDISRHVSIRNHNQGREQRLQNSYRNNDKQVDYNLDSHSRLYPQQHRQDLSQEHQAVLHSQHPTGNMGYNTQPRQSGL